ncbi:MAG: DUF4214 domain-containing protein, partial [Pseudobdellovibrionaceae bacterium]
KAYYIELIQNGMKLEDVYLAMFRSPEFHDLNQMQLTTDRDYINILYYAILGRLPASHESYQWIEVLKTQSRDDVLKSFLSSTEFQQLLVRKGIRASK